MLFVMRCITSGVSQQLSILPLLFSLLVPPFSKCALRAVKFH